MNICSLLYFFHVNIIFWFLFFLGFYDGKQITDSNGNNKESFIGVYGDICLANNFFYLTSVDPHINNDNT